MQKLLPTLALLGLMGLPALVAAQPEHDHAPAGDGAMAQGMMPGMMNHEQMMQMQSRMLEMQELMARIQAEDDPSARMQMMEEHMAKMHDAMGMMGEHDAEADMPHMDMEQRMEMMQGQMGMMGMMMQQMMEHMSAEGSHHAE
jgi:hypothetical protein